MTSRVWVVTPPSYYVADIRARSGGVFPVERPSAFRC